MTGALVGESPGMQRLIALVPRLARSDATILIEGETGTGKSCFARLLHEASARRSRPFVVVDCGAIPATLVDNELFGHEKGAFTGAHLARAGSFEEAQGGTVFLDEVAELPLDAQPKLLRVLEERVIKRVGASRTVRMDLRIIVATNRDLAREVARGAFRHDLYYRLDVVRLRMPPLRERPGDLPLLVEHFYRSCAGDDAAPAPRRLVEALCARPWPGNVRELKHAVERAVSFDEVDASPPSLPIAVEQPRMITPDGPPANVELPYGSAKRTAIAAWERDYVAELLRRHEGNVGQAARAAQMDRTHLKRVIARHGLSRARC